MTNPDTFYNTLIYVITYVTLFAEFPSEQSQIPNLFRWGK